MPEFDDPEIKETQQFVQENYASLMENQDRAVGQFKTAIPLDNQIGVVVMSRSAAEYSNAQTLMSNEMTYLEFLRNSSFNSILPLRTYGEIFKVGASGKEYPAMLVDWISNATLIDSKDPTAYSMLLTGFAIDMKIPTQVEAWPMKLPFIIEKISGIGDEEIDQAQKIVKQLLKKLSDFQNELHEKKIKIADLQLLITLDSNNIVHLTIIDPIAVLEKSKDDVFYEDIIRRGENAEENPDFKIFLSNTDTMLSNMTQWCHSFLADTNKQQFLKNSLEKSLEAPKREDKKPDISSGPLNASSVAQMMLNRKIPNKSTKSERKVLLPSSQNRLIKINQTKGTDLESGKVEASPKGETKRRFGPGKNNENI